MKRKILNFSIILIGLSFCLTGVQAASLGESINFYVDSSYDNSSRSQITATLRAVGDYAYFYLDDDYWQKMSSNNRVAFMEELRELAVEFDTVIYPKERAVFGSEWNPGIDNDSRITVLLTELISQAGGYINTNDEYLKTQVSTSNQREMLYLNAKNIFEEQNKAYLAHEFQHLISFYQKTVLFGLEEDVWLNEARSEYAPTVCGYNKYFPDSYLSDRVSIFVNNPSDSLTEWKNNTTDYGVVSLFIHYLVDHYGQGILTKMILSDKIGIESINQALSDVNSSKTFSDVFNDWAIANYLNNCSIEPKNTYCYLDPNLTYERVHVDYSASYSGFPNLIVSRSSAVKDWAPFWYRFRQGSSIATERDTLELEFTGSTNRGDFRVPYIIFDSNNQPIIGNINLSNQEGIINIPDFSSQNKSIIIIPFNQYKKKYFGSNELSSVFSFSATSVDSSSLTITNLSPSSGTINGGFEVTVKGNNFSNVNKVTLGNENIANFNIIDNQTITFRAPNHAAGFVHLTVSNGDEYTLTNALEYLNNPGTSYSEGSLLRVRGDAKVYVIKGNYKRWIQTADIFNHYGHLKWENIIEVEPSELNKYQESWLIRADGDERVYQIDANGNKRWLNMTGEQFGLSGRNWSSVFVINSYERNAYQTGTNISFQ